MKNDIYDSHTSSLLSANANIIALMAYVVSTLLGWIPVLKYASFFAPLLIFILEKDSEFVRFHSMQAFLLNVVARVFNVIYSLLVKVSVVGVMFGIQHIETGLFSIGIASIVFIASLAINLAIFIFSIIAMIRAYQYTEYHIPLIGTWTERLITK